MWCLGFKVKDRIRVLGSWLWAVWAIPICSSKTCSFHFPFSLSNPYITHYSSFHFLFHYPCITIYIYYSRNGIWHLSLFSLFGPWSTSERRGAEGADKSGAHVAMSPRYWQWFEGSIVGLSQKGSPDCF